MKRHARGPDEWRRVPRRICICPLCGYRVEQTPPVPCYAVRCPRCESMMVEGI